jgi:chorismate mutase
MRMDDSKEQKGQIKNTGLEEIERRLDLLDARITTESARLNERLEIGSEIKGLREEFQALQSAIDGSKVEIDSVKERLKLAKEIADLKTDYEKTIGVAKLFAAVGVPLILSVLGLGGFVLGLVGIHKIEDIEAKAQLRADEAFKKVESGASSRVNEELEQVRDDLDISKAYEKMSRGQFHSAISILSGVLPRRPFDPEVLATLLHAYDQTENWEEGEMVLSKLEENPQELAKINDWDLLNNMAVIRIQEGIEDPRKLRTGTAWLERSRQFIPAGNADALTYFNLNCWLASLAEGDLQSARKYASSIAQPGSTASLDSWEKVSHWRFFKIWLKEHSSLKAEVKEMYSVQKKRIEDAQK